MVSSTTSTEQSGLFGFILPIFKMKTGIDVKVVAVGTGQALDIGRRGDADVVFVHDKPAEEKFVSEGYATKRNEVMYNDFILIGPKADPAKVAGGRDIQAALQKISAAQATFISRGDQSGTRRRTTLLEGGWYTGRLKPFLVQGNRSRHGPRIEHCIRHEWIYLGGSRDLALL